MSHHEVITRRWGDAGGVRGQGPVLVDGRILMLERCPHLTDEELDALAARYHAAGLDRRGIRFVTYVQHPAEIERAVAAMTERLPLLPRQRALAQALEEAERRANPPARAAFVRRIANGQQIERVHPLDGMRREVRRG